MKGRSKTCSQPTLLDFDKSTCFAGLEAGATPSDSPAGATPEAYGLGVAPVSRGQRPAKALAPMIRAIFGMRGSGSLDSAVLSSSLANKLRVRLLGRGSIAFVTTWSTFTTPSGRSICRLRASGHRTSDSVSGSWPTPTVNDATGSTYAYSSGNHDKPVLKLPGVALMRWPTPAARDYKSDKSQKTDAEMYANGGKVGKPLPRNVLKHLGLAPYGSAAQTGCSEQLNPAFVSWLMGYPDGWQQSAVTVTPSSRKLPPK